MKTSVQEENQAFEKIWDRLIDGGDITPTDQPKGYVLGGQPGAGKSNLIENIAQQHNDNIVVVNGDEFRREHPRFAEIQEQYGKDAPKHTAEFAGKMTERVIEKALQEKFNLVVEGTFRTAETPLKTLADMKRNGYVTTACIMTTDAYTSWNSTLERYEGMLAAGEPARYTDKGHHDKVVAELPKNADKVYQSGLADDFYVYNRQGLIFGKNQNPQELPSAAITRELYQYNGARIVADSKSLLHEYKYNDTWHEFEKTANPGVKAGVYMLGTAKSAEMGKTYEGEIVHKDTQHSFQKTKTGLVQHKGISDQVQLGQHYSITRTDKHTVQIKAVAQTMGRSIKR